jgi:hypothetical protein
VDLRLGELQAELELVGLAAPELVERRQALFPVVRAQAMASFEDLALRRGERGRVAQRRQRLRLGAIVLQRGAGARQGRVRKREMGRDGQGLLQPLRGGGVLTEAQALQAFGVEAGGRRIFRQRRHRHRRGRPRLPEADSAPHLAGGAADEMDELRGPTGAAGRRQHLAGAGILETQVDAQQSIASAGAHIGPRGDEIGAEVLPQTGESRQ